MILDCPAAEALSQLAEEKGWAAIEKHRFSDVTMFGVLELSRTVAVSGDEAKSAAEQCLAAVPHARELLSNAWTLWQGQFDPRRLREELFGAPPLELWLVRGSSCIESNEFSLFAHRFQRRLKESGFGLRFAYALSQALIEMTDNVVRHSAAAGEPPAVGLVAYHVVDDAMNYYVADLGRGVLRSLRENPKWSGLSNEGDALVAAARNGASRNAEHSEGDGFRIAFKGFLDRAGVLAMRSGDGLARVSGNFDQREAEIGNAALLRGLRVAATCSLKSGTDEILIRY